MKEGASPVLFGYLGGDDILIGRRAKLQNVTCKRFSAGHGCKAENQMLKAVRSLDEGEHLIDGVR